MKRASYKEAISWIAANDDTCWLDDDNSMISVTAALISELFDVTDEKIIADIRREVKKLEMKK